MQFFSYTICIHNHIVIIVLNFREHQKGSCSLSDLSTEYPIENYTNSLQSDTQSDLIVPTREISTPISKNQPIAYISPFVTINRGKDSARKEFHSRKSKGGNYQRFVSCTVNFTDSAII